jgi:sugar (pentulose or hexulose) kinase
MQQAGAATDLARGAGGGLQGHVWREIMADALGVGIQTTATATGAARGAAVLAGLGVQLYADAAIGIAWPAQPVQRPDAARRAALEPAFRRYEGLYPRLADAFRQS